MKKKALLIDLVPLMATFTPLPSVKERTCKIVYSLGEGPRPIRGHTKSASISASHRSSSGAPTVEHSLLESGPRNAHNSLLVAADPLRQRYQRRQKKPLHFVQLSKMSLCTLLSLRKVFSSELPLVWKVQQTWKNGESGKVSLSGFEFNAFHFFMKNVFPFPRATFQRQLCLSVCPFLSKLPEPTFLGPTSVDKLEFRIVAGHRHRPIIKWHGFRFVS